MNLSEEKNYLKMQEALEDLDLSAKNMEIADKYLNPDEKADKEILKDVEIMDFSKLDKEKTAKSKHFVEHCSKRQRNDLLQTYVSFITAIGGSTATYALNTYSYYGKSIVKEFMTEAQWAAVWAEAVVWNQHTSSIDNLLGVTGAGMESPETLYQAMQLCYNEAKNAKTLLAGIYLHKVKPVSKKGILSGLFSSGKDHAKTAEVAAYLEESIIDSMENMLSGPSLSESDLKRLQDYVGKGDADESIPADLYQILDGATASDYLIKLLAGSAFLAIDHSGSFETFIKLAAAVNPSVTLEALLMRSEAKWMLSHLERMENILPVTPETYMKWCIKHKVNDGLQRYSKKYPQDVEKLTAQLSSENYMYLMHQVKIGNKDLYQKLHSTAGEQMKRILAQEFTNDLTTGKTEAVNYLLGETAITDIYPFVAGWRTEYRYSYRDPRKLISLKEQETQLYERIVIIEALRQQCGFFVYYLMKGTKEQTLNDQDIEGLLQVFERQNLDYRYIFEAADCIYNAYSYNLRKYFLNYLVQYYSSKKPVPKQVLEDLLKTGVPTVRLICAMIMDTSWQEYEKELLSCAADSSKQVREQLVKLYAGHRDWEPNIKDMLKSKKGQEREMAASVLKEWGAANYRPELEAALEAEKSKKIKAVLQDCLGIEGEAEEEKKPAGIEDLVAELHKGGKKRKIAWAYETPFSAVHKTDGSEADEDYMQAILIGYADMGIPGICKEVQPLAEKLVQSELNLYMSELMDKWLNSNAEAKKKWVVYAASIHGGEAIVPKLMHQIQEWPAHARGAMAVEGVKALALNGSAQALLLVDNISRKFKFRQVKVAAGEALHYAAEQMGMTKEELEDKIVPNLGFDETLKQVFDYGERSFTVYLTPALELEVFDGNDKKLKNLPAPGKRDNEEQAKAAYEQFKLMKKQLKTVVTNQKLRLEQALLAERLWDTEKWQALFVHNPVMHQFAIGLIWGTYEDGELKDTFRYMEDGSFNTMDEEEYELPENGRIGLVHPIELDKESLETWQEQLEDYEITQPFVQLKREVYSLTEEEKGQGKLLRFGGKLLNGLSLSGKLQGMGWYRGSVQDAGVYHTFYREDGTIGVELNFSGCYVGDENEEVTVYDAVFYKPGTVKRGSYVYDKAEGDKTYKLEAVSARYFSEIVLQLEKATASSQERVPYTG